MKVAESLAPYSPTLVSLKSLLATAATRGFRTSCERHRTGDSGLRELAPRRDDLLSAADAGDCSGDAGVVRRHQLRASALSRQGQRRLAAAYARSDRRPWTGGWRERIMRSRMVVL